VLAFLRKLSSTFSVLQAEDKVLQGNLYRMIGTSPLNLDLYKLALKHTSMNNGSGAESNERLEYLGDAILGAVVAEYLFKKYPFKDEGFLTEIRSRIVNRQSLNDLAIKIGLNKFVRFDHRKNQSKSGTSIYGDAMEALVGAVYLDLGFPACKKFIVKELLQGYFDMDVVVSAPSNFKSQIIEWSQKENHIIRFIILREEGKNHHKEFEAQVLINDEPFGTGKGFSKKKAEQAAAENSWKMIAENPPKRKD
jgi:ribonuclease III